jgi:hypothetical protein
LLVIEGPRSAWIGELIARDLLLLGRLRDQRLGELGRLAVRDGPARPRSG